LLLESLHVAFSVDSLYIDLFINLEGPLALDKLMSTQNARILELIDGLQHNFLANEQVAAWLCCFGLFAFF
jgi:hypothetical protein